MTPTQHRFFQSTAWRATETSIRPATSDLYAGARRGQMEAGETGPCRCTYRFAPSSGSALLLMAAGGLLIARRPRQRGSALLAAAAAPRRCRRSRTDCAASWAPLLRSDRVMLRSRWLEPAKRWTISAGGRAGRSAANSLPRLPERVDRRFTAPLAATYAASSTSVLVARRQRRREVLDYVVARLQRICPAAPGEAANMVAVVPGRGSALLIGSAAISIYAPPRVCQPAALSPDEERRLLEIVNDCDAISPCSPVTRRLKPKRVVMAAGRMQINHHHLMLSAWISAHSPGSHPMPQTPAHALGSSRRDRGPQFLFGGATALALIAGRCARRPPDRYRTRHAATGPVAALRPIARWPRPTTLRLRRPRRARRASGGQRPAIRAKLEMASGDPRAEMMRRFFGEFGQPRPGPRSRRRRLAARGILAKRWVPASSSTARAIVTNNHVIARPTRSRSS